MVSNYFQQAKVFAIGLVGSLALRIINCTLRWEYVGLDGKDRFWADREPCILIFWHGRQLLMPWIYLRHKSTSTAPAMTALISQHRDGRLVARAMRFLGIQSVAGSSSRRGVPALHSLIRMLNSHSHVAVTPDGPKGPAHKLKDGIMFLAQKTGTEICPAAFAAEKFWRFKSWDGMILPKPFSKAVMIKGPAIRVAAEMSAEEMITASKEVEDALNRITLEADDYWKQPV